jgi:pimeloyl-ACP methyl ester carboxylesterase
MILLVMGFSFYRQPRAKFFKSFPFRPLTLLSLKPSASPNFSYFYRPHKSTTHRPIVFIHGLGIGLISYIPLFFMLPKDVGILALEVLPITSRITESGILPADQAREIGDIIAQQGLDSFVFVGHSYGTFLAKLLLESSFLASRMERIVLIDPIAVLLHVPELAYNATTRTPKYPGEIEIEWAATAEPDIAFTLAKRFCWRSHILWYEDLLRCPTTVVVGSEDCLMNADAIATYVTKGAPQPDPTSVEPKPDLQWSWADRKSWGRNEWSGEGLELYWLEGYDHGQAVFSAAVLRNIVKIVTQYCVRGTLETGSQRELSLPPGDDDVELSQSFGLASILKRKEVQVTHSRNDSGTTRSFFEHD